MASSAVPVPRVDWVQDRCHHRRGIANSDRGGRGRDDARWAAEALGDDVVGPERRLATVRAETAQPNRGSTLASASSSARPGYWVAGACRAAMATSSRSGQDLGRLRPGDRVLVIDDEHRHPADADALGLLVGGRDLAPRRSPSRNATASSRSSPLLRRRREHLGSADVAAFLEQRAEQSRGSRRRPALLLGEQDETVGERGVRRARHPLEREATPSARPLSSMRR